jgi:uncharacterized protein (TIGR03435 family)
MLTFKDWASAQRYRQWFPNSRAALFSIAVATSATRLGLELRPAKGPMDGMIIDHIERPPEN